MILYMQRELLLMKKMILTIVVLLGVPLIAHGQLSLTIEKALDIAEENSPTLRRSHMNLDRYQENLVAQRASLKSRFSLDLTRWIIIRTAGSITVCRSGILTKRSVRAAPSG